MWKWMVMIGLIGSLFVPQTRGQTAHELAQLLISDDGLISMRVPEGWYLSTETSENRVLLVAAPTAEQAADRQNGEFFHVYWDAITDGDENALLQSTLKSYGFGGLPIEETSVNWMGIEGTQVTTQTDARQMRLVIAHLPETDQWIRFVGVSADQTLIDAIQASLMLLPQIAQTPRGWSASIRAPMGWEESGYSSFIQWKAPEDSLYEGMEVWFQAGVRSDLVGDGEPTFVLQSLGIMYATQVDETTKTNGYLGGLSASRVEFESFTHFGYTINGDSTADFGTANLVARAPLGTWSPAHDALLEAMVASVQIVPPTADAAPVGLRTGYRAPEFSGELRDGTPFSTGSLQGQLVFVHFWFVDCPYCREEWPHLQTVYNEYQAQGMVVLAINAIDSSDYIDSYFASAGLDVPVVLERGELHDLFNVSAFPTTFVIGPDGLIVSVSRGVMSEKNMRFLAEQYLD